MNHAAGYRLQLLSRDNGHARLRRLSQMHLAAPLHVEDQRRVPLARHSEVTRDHRLAHPDFGQIADAAYGESFSRESFYYPNAAAGMERKR